MSEGFIADDGEIQLQHTSHMGSSVKRLPAVAAVIMAVSLMLPTTSQAQIELPQLPTSSPSPSPTPTKTTTSSPKPKPTSSTGGSSGGGTSSGGSSSGSTSTSTTRKSSTRTQTTKPRPPLPPAVARALAQWLSRPKSPARTTTRLLELIDSANGAAAPTLAEQRLAFGHFPVIGYVWYQDDYGAPRFGAFYNMHEGTDLFAVTGTPVIAAVDGSIMKMQVTRDRGRSIWLRATTGAYYFYGHLGRFAPGLQVGQQVRTGQLIGAVGTSADAQGTSPHVHFEIHPLGTPDTVNPKPVLDAWLSDAVANATRTLGAHRTRELLAPYGAAHWNTLFGMLAEPVEAPPAFWVAAYDGTGSTAAYADLALGDLLRALDQSGPEPTAEAMDPVVRLIALAYEGGAEHQD